VVSFAPLLLYPQGESPRYPLDRRLGEPQIQSGHCGEEKHFALSGIEPRRSAHGLSLYTQSYPNSRRYFGTSQNFGVITPHQKPAGMNVNALKISTFCPPEQNMAKDKVHL
jgi:hypothetical protein